MNILLSTLLEHLFFVSYAIIILLELPVSEYEEGVGAGLGGRYTGTATPLPPPG
jgi:hypothetical protein